MKKNPLENEITPQYIIDKKGKKTAIILSIKTYEKLLEEFEDLYLGRVAQEILKNDTEVYTLEEVEKELHNKRKKTK
jgi:predicted DNA-binding protein